MDWKAKLLIQGGLIGAVVGLATAWLYARSADVQVDHNGNPRLPEVKSADLLRIGVSLVAALRTIIGLGSADD